LLTADNNLPGLKPDVSENSPGFKPDVSPGLEPDRSGKHPGNKSGSHPGDKYQRSSALYSRSSVAMLKKIFRLSGEDLKKFFSKKYKKIGNNIFLIFYQKNNLPHPRFALLPKREIFKKAFKRNKIRRQVYAIIREILKEKKIKNYDFFIIIQKEEKFQQLKELLEKILTDV